MTCYSKNGIWSWHFSLFVIYLLCILQQLEKWEYEGLSAGFCTKRLKKGKEYINLFRSYLAIQTWTSFQSLQHRRKKDYKILPFFSLFLSFSDLISSFLWWQSLKGFKYCSSENAFNENPDTLILSRHARYASNIFLQSLPLLLFFKIGVLKNFTKFTGKS